MSTAKTVECDICLQSWTPKGNSQQIERIFYHYMGVHVNKANPYRTAFLNHHRNAKHAKMCDYCSKSVLANGSKNLFSHYVRLHTNLPDNEKRQCLLSKKEQPGGETRKECDECLWKTHRGLFAHFRNKHANPPDTEKLRCDSCELMFWRRCTLTRHIDTAHIAPKDKGGKGVIKCDVCSHEFKSCDKNSAFKHYLLRHAMLTKRDKSVCDVCNYECLLLNDLWRHSIGAGHMAQEDQQKAECDLCGMQFKNKAGIMCHYLFKHGADKESFFCDHCDFTTSYKSILGIHTVQHYATNGALYQCGVCEQLFKSIAGRHHHQQLEHDNVVYVCDGCGRRFTQKRSVVNCSNR